MSKSENMRASLCKHAEGVKGEIVINEFIPGAVELFLKVLHLEDVRRLGKQ